MRRAPSRMVRIAEAAEWRLLGLLFERPHAAWHEEVAALAREVQDPEIRAAAAAARGATEGNHLALLGPGGAVSPREVTYCPFADPGRVLADLAATYAAFVFQPRAEESLDHLAVEAGFVGYLLLKEAFALARGDCEAASTTAVARLGFMEAHLAAFGGMFAQRLELMGPSYLLPSARVIAARLPQRPTVQMPPSALDVPDICGACGLGSGD